MFAEPAIAWSTTDRATWPHLLAEVVATAGLVLVIFALVRTGRGHLAAPAVGAYIGAAYFFTSSTSFANPAITIGRAFTDTFAGIAPASVLPFIAAQLGRRARSAGRSFAPSFRPPRRRPPHTRKGRSPPQPRREPTLARSVVRRQRDALMGQTAKAPRMLSAMPTGNRPT